MKTDLFISYAWTSNAHREWVRLLASQLHLIGYVVKIDEAVDYGASLSGFMQEVTEASHVLLIVDENYVERANNKPDSGVGIETKWISETFVSKPATWLSVVLVRNPERKLPNWLNAHNPKGFDFNSSPENNEFPGAAQIDAIWRWVEDLPADKNHAVPLSVLRNRAGRLERINARRDPGHYTNPTLNGRVTFCYKDYAHYTVGNGEYQFKIKFSGCSQNSVHIYIDGGLKAVGLITGPNFDPLTVESFLTLGRVVSPIEGQRAVLLNSYGALCVISIEQVQCEVNAKEYVPEHVTFTYEVLVHH
ncbi:toll/interleukin-1 receptor domain-containing protein [Shewanella nanhaiensis]|uniref:Toll/interleukin-1 receptor domain-containing protein n=1 Tax=Shewanella nanhaiensis TaxID=2864872 RepID=A0ABS7E9A0_9GAMM|nr:toll/interleukin-1 receptor domain-containing protein [Shewanella nanhaiensis]MBW8186200.1 toll/interleukin-1 receptor domain-containing protein [Shewanella nanhaiensis]